MESLLAFFDKHFNWWSYQWLIWMVGFYRLQRERADDHGLWEGPWSVPRDVRACQAWIRRQHHLVGILWPYNTKVSKLGLKVTCPKMKAMHIGDGPDPLHVGTDAVERVVNLWPEIDCRRGLAAGVMNALQRTLWHHSAISWCTKLHVYNASALCVLLYGAESRPICKTLAAQLDGFNCMSLMPRSRSVVLLPNDTSAGLAMSSDSPKIIQPEPSTNLIQQPLAGRDLLADLVPGGWTPLKVT